MPNETPRNLSLREQAQLPGTIVLIEENGKGIKYGGLRVIAPLEPITAQEKPLPLQHISKDEISISPGEMERLMEILARDAQQNANRRQQGRGRKAPESKL